MGRKLKYTAAAAAVAAVAAAVLLVWLSQSRGAKEPLAYIPAPDKNALYILLEAKGRSYPRALSSLLTEGPCADLKSGTPRGAALAAAALAEDAAVLVERGKNGEVGFYCAARFSDEESALLRKGTVPASLAAAFGAEKAESAEGIFTVRGGLLSSPLYYAVAGGSTLFAAEPSALGKMLSFDKKEGGLKNKKWTREEKWPAHIEISDGGELTKRAKEQIPLTVEAAWRAPEGEAPGEARWALVNLGAAAEAYLSSALATQKWNLSECVLPRPLLLSAGFGIPRLEGSPDGWPFHLSQAYRLARDMGLDDSEISEILSGRTILSLGGQNKILWFRLPGLLAEFSGRPELMSKLVASFWNGFFYGVEPEPLEGFERGGTADVPFSVVAAGRGETAVLGLVFPDAIASGDDLAPFMAKEEEAVGWLFIDLPKAGKTLSEMTKMSSFLEEEEDQDLYRDQESYGEARGYPWETENDLEPREPEFAQNPFDRAVVDSFAETLKKFGRVMIVWEKPLSGRVNWYNHENGK